MLEMFSDKSLLELSQLNIADVRQEYCYYDLSNLKHKELKLPFGSIPSHCRVVAGGIRRNAFGIGGCLFKFPLIRLSKGLQLMKLAHHRINGGRVRLADFSSVLFHYLFTGSLLRKSRNAVQENNYKNGSEKYHRFLEVLSNNPQLCLYELAREPREYKNTEHLIRQGLLSCSRRFRGQMEN
jgi:hypothetical protein